MRVVVVNNSMEDFVTSNDSIMEFDTRKECEEYVRGSESFHPGRYSYRIEDKEVLPAKKQQEDMRPVDPIPVIPYAWCRTH